MVFYSFLSIFSTFFNKSNDLCTKVKTGRVIISLLSLLFLCYTSAFSEESGIMYDGERLRLIKSLLDNNLGFSPKINPNEIVQWEYRLVNAFRKQRDYERMFLMKHEACRSLISQGYITDALAKARKALDEAKKMKYDKGVAISYLAIGDAYFNASMIEEAVVEYEEAMQLLSNISHSHKLQERVLQQLIPAYVKINKVNKIKKYLNQVSVIYANRRYNHFLWHAFNAYYNIHTDRNKEALLSLDNAERWYKRYPFAYHKFVLRQLKAEYAEKTGDYREAIALYNSFSNIKSPLDTYDGYIKTEYSIAIMFIKLGDYRKACETYEKINAVRDSIEAQNYSSQVNLLRTIYQVDHLTVENQSQRSTLLSYLTISCATILIISILSAFHVRKINKRLALSKVEQEKARVKLENSMRTKSLFLSNMSHEIRTPLNALSGFSTILTDKNIDAETRKQCNDIILQNSDLLLKLIDDVVDLSSLDTGKMHFHFTVCDAVSICHGIIDTVNKIKQTSAILVFESSLEQLDLYTDGARLQQLLFNLLINATKFTPSGTITLSLELQSPKKAIFSVTDTGCGISPEKRNNIFNRFEKLDENVQGSGLGLSISQLIVERFGGKIWIDPDYKDGARFFFTHPLTRKSRKEAVK